MRSLDQRRSETRADASAERPPSRWPSSMPLLFLVVAGIVDFGRVFFIQIQLTNAAREGARAAIVMAPNATVITRASNAAAGVPSPTVSVHRLVHGRQHGQRDGRGARRPSVDHPGAGHDDGRQLDLRRPEHDLLHGGHAMRWLSDRRAPSRPRDKGAVAAIVAILVSSGVVMGMLALTVDVGNITAERRQLQNGADAATFALARSCSKSPVGAACASPAAASTTSDEPGRCQLRRRAAGAADASRRSAGATSRPLARRAPSPARPPTSPPACRLPTGLEPACPTSRPATTTSPRATDQRPDLVLREGRSSRATRTSSTPPAAGRLGGRPAAPAPRCPW